MMIVKIWRVAESMANFCKESNMMHMHSYSLTDLRAPSVLAMLMLLYILSLPSLAGPCDIWEGMPLWNGHSHHKVHAECWTL